MRIFLRYNFQFIILLLSWLFVGMYGGILIYPYILGSLMFLKLNGREKEIFLGFLFVLICSDNLEQPMAWAKTVKNIYILLIAGFLILDRKNFQGKIQFFAPYIPFFLVAVICLYWAATPVPGIQKTLSYFLLFLSIPNYVTHIYLKEGSRFFADLLWFFVFILITSIFLKYYLPEVGMSHGERLRGMFGNPNGLGIFIIVSFIYFHIVKNHFSDKIGSQETLLIYGIFFLCAYWSGSRTCLTAILSFLLLHKVFKIHPFIGFFVFALIVVFSGDIMDLLISTLVNLGMAEDLRLENLEEGSGRLIAWAFAWEEIKTNLFLGRGISYDEYLMRSNFDMLSRMGHEGGVHNTYLIIWLNTGLIGLIFYFTAFFKYFIRASKLTTYAIPAMLTLMFSVNFEPWMASSLNPFTSIYLVIIVVISYDLFIEPENNLEHYAEEIEEPLEHKMAEV